MSNHKSKFQIACEELNAEQLRAVEHGFEMNGRFTARPLLVIAGAGTGKTQTLACRVARLVDQGCDPSSIMLLTFSRKAARQMTRRVEALCDFVPNFQLPWSGTFHSIGARILRNHARELNLAPDFTILDREDSIDLMNLVRNDLGLSSTERRFPSGGTCLSIYSRAVNTGMALEDVVRDDFSWCMEWLDAFRRLFTAYVEAKLAQEALDYDDLLLLWAEAMNDEGFARTLSERFAHVVVDEYQDTNRLQASIVRALKPDGLGVTVVGDDAQSIYSFRDALIRNILDFPHSFDPPATVVTLERSYRSTQPILDAANAIISLAAERFTKNLWSDRGSTFRPRLVAVEDEAAQARFVADEILRVTGEGVALRSQCVLFRSSHHAAMLEVELTQRRIPFVKVGGMRFLDSKHVKDVLGVLRWIRLPENRIAGFRTLCLLPGIGSANATKVLEHVAGREDRSATLSDAPCPSRSRPDLRTLATLVERLASPDIRWPAPVELATEWYLPHLERLHEDFVARSEDLVQLGLIASSHENFESFLDELVLDPSDASGTTSDVDAPDDLLTLSTIHSAKGLEWAKVFILNAVDGAIPTTHATRQADIEEERRILYVAVTRARDFLDVLVPRNIHAVRSSREENMRRRGRRTRFIPDAVACLFEAVDPGTSKVEPVSGSSEERPPIDLRHRLRERWKEK